MMPEDGPSVGNHTPTWHSFKQSVDDEGNIYHTLVSQTYSDPLNYQLTKNILITAHRPHLESWAKSKEEENQMQKPIIILVFLLLAVNSWGVPIACPITG